MKSNTELLREMMNTLNEIWREDDDRFDDDPPEPTEDEKEQAEYRERRANYMDNEDIDHEIMHWDWVLADLPHYDKMAASGDFYFEERNVTSLEGSPYVVHDFIFTRNRVSSLANGPYKVTGTFDCSENRLTSFEHGPSKASYFYSENNPITSLKGSPESVKGDYYVVGPEVKLQSYDGIPQHAGCIQVPLIGDGSLRVLKGCFGQVIYLNLVVTPGQVIRNVLNAFMINGLTRLLFECGKDPKIMEAQAIVNEFLPMGKKGMMQCQTALIKAGFPDWGTV